MTIFHERLVKNLKYFRRLRNLSQSQLAKACGLTANYIGEIEIGRKFPSADTMEKIVKVLNIQPETLFSQINHDDIAAGFHAGSSSYASQLGQVVLSYINESLGTYKAQKIYFDPDSIPLRDKETQERKQE